MSTTEARARATGDLVLVVDDDADLSELLRVRLERDGFRVETFSSVNELAVCCCASADPAAVVIDLNLGSQDGLQAAELLADKGFKGPVFLISGFDDRVIAAARRHAEALGLALPAVFRKPFSLAELSAAIVQAIGDQRPDDVSEIRTLLASGRIRPFFQPVVDLASGAIVAAEALARWVQPDGTVNGAGRLLPMIANENLWHEFTEAMLRETVATLRRWLDAGLTPCPISINLEASVATDPDFGPRAAAILGDGKVAPGLIRFEITEQTAMGDSASALRALTWLRIKGFDLSIDDFGTGFSSLVVLHAMPFSELKIDQSFVKRMTTDAGAMIIVKAIVDLAHNLSLACIAEGVETEATAAALRDIGCDRGQGYLFGGAMDAERFASRLRPPD
ncbi:EAL domain-containing protein [Zavarzinia sp.]|uniref:EAL domain-containing response regulator n=1 Tax=Zavarzinia sp. TaxID=2027920 RepID=UPI003BB48C89